MNAKLKDSPEISNKIPNAVDMAQELISNNPTLFKDSLDTRAAIAEVMVDFYKKCDAYLNPPITQDSFFKMAGNITKAHAKNFYDIDMDDFAIHSKEESIMDRGCHGQF